MKAFTNALIFDGEKFLKDTTLLVENDRVAELIGRVPEDAEVIDCSGKVLAPGFIDLQIYGGGGYLFSSSLSKESLISMADDLVKKGTTGFFITLATNSFEVYHRAVEIVKETAHPAVLGVHLEGPYINPVKKGAHIEHFIIKPDDRQLEELLERAEGVVKMMTLAPEQCTPQTIDLLKKYGVHISAGHSNATFEEAMSGFAGGIHLATHLFNAMSPFHHRDTGLPGAVFLSEEVSASIIADGIHVDFETLKIAKKLLADRLFYITDAVEEVLQGEYIHMHRGDRFTLPDGTLSGSALTMPLSVKNGIRKAGFSEEESLRMATMYPAKAAAQHDRGRLKKGFPAHVVCLSGDWELEFTFFEGKIVTG